METLDAAVLLVGLVCVVAGWIGLLIAGFREHVLWGLAMLFIHVVAFFFIIVHWDKAKRSFLLWLIGWIAVVAASAMSAKHGHKLL